MDGDELNPADGGGGRCPSGGATTPRPASSGPSNSHGAVAAWSRGAAGCAVVDDMFLVPEVVCTRLWGPTFVQTPRARATSQPRCQRIQSAPPWLAAAIRRQSRARPSIRTPSRSRATCSSALPLNSSGTTVGVALLRRSRSHAAGGKGSSLCACRSTSASRGSESAAPQRLAWVRCSCDDDGHSAKYPSFSPIGRAHSSADRCTVVLGSLAPDLASESAGSIMAAPSLSGASELIVTFLEEQCARKTAVVAGSSLGDDVAIIKSDLPAVHAFLVTNAPIDVGRGGTARYTPERLPLCRRRRRRCRAGSRSTAPPKSRATPPRSTTSRRRPWRSANRASDSSRSEGGDQHVANALGNDAMLLLAVCRQVRLQSSRPLEQSERRKHEIKIYLDSDAKTISPSLPSASTALRRGSLVFVRRAARRRSPSASGGRSAPSRTTRAGRRRRA